MTDNNRTEAEERSDNRRLCSIGRGRRPSHESGSNDQSERRHENRPFPVRRDGKGRYAGGVLLPRGSVWKHDVPEALGREPTRAYKVRSPSRIQPRRLHA